MIHTDAPDDGDCDSARVGSLSLEHLQSKIRHYRDAPLGLSTQIPLALEKHL